MKDLLLTTRVGLVETVANGEVLKIIEGDHSLFVSNFEETISVKGAVKDVYQGPFEFDLVTVNEGGLHEELKDSTVSEVERWSSVDELSWTEDVGVDISSLSEGEDGDVACESLRRITHLANIGDGEREPRLRRLYKQEIRSLLLDQVEKHPIDPDCRVIVPLRAALPAAALMGVEPDQIMEVEEKRLAFKAGNIFTGKKDLAVGISMIDEMGWEDFLSLDGQEANVVEGCIATGFTVTQLFQVGLSM